TAPSFGGSGAVNSGFGNIRISLPNERERTQEDIVNMLNRNFQAFNFGRTFARQEATISVQRGIGGLPVAFVLQNINFDKLTKILPEFLEEAYSNKAFQNVDVD